MTPLTLRGIKDSGPMFWRGDITNAQDFLNERTNFSQGFGIVFQALNGLDSALPQQSIDQLTDWALSIIPPPNPHRALDQVLTASEARGMDIFLNGSPNGNGGRIMTDVIFNCVTCHSLNPAMGFFGTSGRNTIEGETQFFKVTQLRTVYDKVGMFGHTFADNGDPRPNGGVRTNVGPQIRASGTLHDGSAAGAEEFLTAGVFELTAAGLLDVVNFTMAFPSNFAPVVGQQVTLRTGSGADVNTRINTLKARAGASFVLPGNQTMTECNLVARAVSGGQLRGFLFRPATNDFMDSTGAIVSDAQLRTLAPVTFTCVFPGGGRRLAIDRDQDNVLDGNDMMLNAAPNGGAPPPVDTPMDPGLGGLADFLAALVGILQLLGSLGMTGS
jgi:hypothetical protein